MGLSALHPKIYGVLDIGTSAVRAVIATPHEHHWNILGWGAYPSSGMKKGQIQDWDRLFRCVQCTWDQTLLHAGLTQLDRVAMNLGHPTLGFELSRYQIPLRKGRVTAKDLSELKAQLHGDLENDEQKILHTLTQSYKIDDETPTLMPLGKPGKNIQWEALNVITASQPLKTKSELLSRLGIELSDPVVDMLAASKAVLTQEECDQGVLMIDVGAGSTKWILYSNNVPKMMKILPIGGDQLTADIALALKTSLATAEVLKVRHGSVAAATPMGSAAYTNLTSDQKSMILDQQALNYLNQVMTMRLEEMFSLILGELAKHGLTPVVASKVVLTGGLAQIYGLTALAEQVFGVPARTGVPLGVTGQAPFFQSPSAATLMGLLAWSREQDLAKLSSPLPRWKKMMNTLQDWIIR